MLITQPRKERNEGSSNGSYLPEDIKMQLKSIIEIKGTATQIMLILFTISFLFAGIYGEFASIKNIDRILNDEEPYRSIALLTLIIIFFIIIISVKFTYDHFILKSYLLNQLENNEFTYRTSVCQRKQIFGRHQQRIFFKDEPNEERVLVTGEELRNAEVGEMYYIFYFYKDKSPSPRVIKFILSSNNDVNISYMGETIDLWR